jgi:hypothetical protein
MFAGDTKILEITVTDDSNAVINITGVLIRWQLSKTVKDPPLVSKAVGSGITIVNGPAGRFDVLINPADTLALIGSHYHEVEIDDSGVISTVLTGKVTITEALIDPVALQRRQMRAI